MKVCSSSNAVCAFVMHAEVAAVTAARSVSRAMASCIESDALHCSSSFPGKDVVGASTTVRCDIRGGDPRSEVESDEGKDFAISCDLSKLFIRKWYCVVW